MISWVVGRGLLGQSVERALATRGPVWSAPERLRWGNSDALADQFRRAGAAFAAAIGDAPWQVAWCAGAGVVGSAADDLEAETVALERFLAGLAPAMLGRGSRCFFLASSAGGIYAGAAGPPFTERAIERPIAAYGETKLSEERLVRGWAAEHEVALLIGRIANLYGPGQDVSKPQGLISRLGLAMLQRQPVVLYVPLDTIRDYLYAPDCGAMVADSLARLRRETRSARLAPQFTKILATQQGTSVASVLAELRRVLKRAPRVVVGASPLGRLQAHDLRLRSVVWPEIDARRLTPLPTGVHSVVTDLLARIGRGEFRIPH